MSVERQEADLTLWADGVAAELEHKERPELAAIFRALARRDGEAIRLALDVLAGPMLEAVAEMIDEERRDRARAGQERVARILAWAIALVREAEDLRGPDLGPAPSATVQ